MKYGHKPGAHWIEETKEQKNQALADYRVTSIQSKYGLKVRNKKYLQLRQRSTKYTYKTVSRKDSYGIQHKSGQSYLRQVCFKKLILAKNKTKQKKPTSLSSKEKDIRECCVKYTLGQVYTSQAALGNSSEGAHTDTTGCYMRDKQPQREGAQEAGMGKPRASHASSQSLAATDSISVTGTNLQLKAKTVSACCPIPVTSKSQGF